MDDASGWPATPGVPANPDKDGWHWLSAAKTEIGEWSAKDQAWIFADDDDLNSATWIGRVIGYRYLGPCLLPSEVAAQVAAARRAGIEDCITAAWNAALLGQEARENDKYPRVSRALRALLEEEGA